MTTGRKTMWMDGLVWKTDRENVVVSKNDAEVFHFSADIRKFMKDINGVLFPFMKNGNSIRVAGLDLINNGEEIIVFKGKTEVVRFYNSVKEMKRIIKCNVIPFMK